VIIEKINDKKDNKDYRNKDNKRKVN